MTKAISVKAFNDYSIVVQLQDGRILKLDLSNIKSKSGPVVEPLKDFSEFSKVFIQEGIITWPTGYDIDPYYIEEAGVPAA